MLNEYFPRDPLKKERVNLPRERFGDEMMTADLSQSSFAFSNLANYVLKVCGRNIFLVGPDRIIDFTYIRRYEFNR